MLRSLLTRFSEFVKHTASIENVSRTYVARVRVCVRACMHERARVCVRACERACTRAYKSVLIFG